MTKLKIKVPFTDKNTGDKYITGEEIEFSESRAKELLADERELVSTVRKKKEVAPEQPEKEIVEE